MHEESLSFTHTLNDTHTWSVTFTSLIATVTTTVTGEYKDVIDLAKDLLKEEYGLNLDWATWCAEFVLLEWGKQ